MTTPAGWYPDPSGASGQRYFDGAHWTEHSTPPAALAPSSAPAPAAAPAKQNNIVGIIALVASVIGFVFACIPGALVVGWILLPTAFVLGVVGLFLTGKARGTSVVAIVLSIVGTVVGVVVFFTVVSDAFKDSFNESHLTASPPPSPAAESPDSSSQSGGTDDGNQIGSRENPFPIGATVSNEDWDITLGAPREAWAEIASENQFNNPPKTGMEYWMVPVTATYTGDETGNTAFGISVKFVGSDNRTYDDYCGVIPAPVADVGELYPGGEAAGNACVAVPAGAKGLWTVTTGFGEPAFFEAK